MRTRTSALLALASACALGPQLPREPTGARVLEVTGRIRGGPHGVGAGDLASWPRRSLRGTDPVSGRTAAYEGADLSALLAGVQRERGVDTVIVRTEGRLAAAVPLWIVWQFRPVLADRADGAPLPGLVLAWPNADQPGLGGDPRALSWWATGVVALELVEWPVHARALAPPVGASPAARLGAGPFQARCLGCHVARGVGGGVGPDLTHVAERLDPDAFAMALRNHRAWPASRPEVAPPAEETGRIHAYLAALGAAARAGVPDEPAEERPGAAGSPGGGRP
jgi:mono/diheme cytochrome c family protein